MQGKRLLQITSALAGIGGFVYFNGAIKENPKCGLMKKNIAAIKRKVADTTRIRIPKVYAGLTELDEDTVNAIRRLEEKTNINVEGYKRWVGNYEYINCDSFVIFFDYNTNVPVFTYEYLTPAEITSKKTKLTPRLPEIGAGKKKVSWPPKTDTFYGHGHMVAYANHLGGEYGRAFTGLVENRVLQHRVLDSGIWNVLEKCVRDTALMGKYDGVHVFTGPVYYGKQITKLEDHYIPDFFFKTMLIEKDEHFYIMSFLVKNYQALPNQKDCKYADAIPWITNDPYNVDHLTQLGLLKDLNLDNVTIMRGLYENEFEFPIWFNQH